jgi:hypothetical protein
LAALQVQLFDGTITLTVTDNQAGDMNSDLGVVVVMTQFADWTVNVTTGISKPILGSADAPHIDLSSVHVTSNSTGSLSIRVRDTDFTSVNGALSPAGFETLIGGTTGGTVTVSTYVDGSNSGFELDPTGTSMLVSSLGPFAGGAFSGTTTGYVPETGSLPSPFSATIEVNIAHTTAWTSTSFDAEFVGLPEPSGAVTWLGIVSLTACACILYRRRSAPRLARNL